MAHKTPESDVFSEAFGHHMESLQILQDFDWFSCTEGSSFNLDHDGLIVSYRGYEVEGVEGSHPPQIRDLYYPSKIAYPHVPQNCVRLGSGSSMGSATVASALFGSSFADMRCEQDRLEVSQCSAEEQRHEVRTQPSWIWSNVGYDSD
jgi:hypothetical protein